MSLSNLDKVILKKIIKVKIKGRLGNQFFQIGFAYKLWKKYPRSILIIDKSWYKKNKLRDLFIEKFGIKTLPGDKCKFFLDELPISSIFSNEKKLDLKCNVIFLFHDFILFLLKTYKYITKLVNINYLPKKGFYRFLSKFGLFTDSNREYIDYDRASCEIITVSGYFQDIGYIRSFREELRDLLLIKPKLNINNYLSGNTNNSFESLSFMVRLGNDSISNINTEKFLLKTFSSIKKSNKKINYILFTDNLIKLKNIKVNIENPIFCISKDPLIQLYFASKSNYFVLSNSSFAWWAYFLSNNKKKIIYKPREWFSSSLSSPGFIEKDFVIDVVC